MKNPLSLGLMEDHLHLVNSRLTIYLWDKTCLNLIPVPTILPNRVRHADVDRKRDSKRQTNVLLDRKRTNLIVLMARKCTATNLERTLQLLEKKISVLVCCLVSLAAADAVCWPLGQE